MEATCFFSSNLDRSFRKESLHGSRLAYLYASLLCLLSMLCLVQKLHLKRLEALWLSFQTTGNHTIRAYWVHGTGSSSAWKTVLVKALQDGELSMHKSPKSKTVNRDKMNQGRLIALFRRIQNLISEGESGNRNDTRCQLSTDDSSLQGSVNEFLHQSDSDQVNSKQSERPARKARKPKKEKSIPVSQHPSNNNLTRPPSNFTKKSPIPSPTPLRSYEHNVDKVEGLSSEAYSEPEKLEEMKLSELKEVAKERGMRGYSKLKKSELVDLLRSQVIDPSSS